MRWIASGWVFAALTFQPGALIAGSPHPQSPSSSVVMFSDVRVVEDTGDTVGTELVIRATGEQLCGVLRQFEGSPISSVVPLSGYRYRGRLSLRGEQGELRVTVDGTEDESSFAGVVIFLVGETPHEVTVLLPIVTMTDDARRALERGCPTGSGRD